MRETCKRQPKKRAELKAEVKATIESRKQREENRWHTSQCARQYHKPSGKKWNEIPPFSSWARKWEFGAARTQ